MHSVLLHGVISNHQGKLICQCCVVSYIWSKF